MLLPATLIPASAGSSGCLVTLKAFLAPQAMTGTRSDKAQVICVTHHSEFEALCDATITVCGSMLTRCTGLSLLPEEHFNHPIRSETQPSLQIGKDEGGTFCKQAARSGPGLPPAQTRARRT